MKNDSAIAQKLVETNGLLDKLILETAIPKSDRDFLTQYKITLSSQMTSKLDDQRFHSIFGRWITFYHIQ